MTDAILILITTANRTEAENIAELLIEMRLAACVQILPEITSFYRWENAIQKDTEILLLIKTTADNFAKIEQTARENHSYEVPEIVAVPMTLISAPYLKWLTANVS